jgi:hypothetical protein
MGPWHCTGIYNIYTIKSISVSGMEFWLPGLYTPDIWTILSCVEIDYSVRNDSCVRGENETYSMRVLYGQTSGPPN